MYNVLVLLEFAIMGKCLAAEVVNGKWVAAFVLSPSLQTCLELLGSGGQSWPCCISVLYKKVIFRSRKAKQRKCFFCCLHHIICGRLQDN